MLYSQKQKQEIKEAIDFGLSKEELKLIKRVYLNSNQMKEIRLGLEEGLGYRLVKTYAHFYISASRMKDRRKEMEKGELLIESERKYHLTILFIFCCIFLVIFFIGSSYLFYYSFFVSYPNTEIENEEIYLSCGEKLSLDIVDEYEIINSTNTKVPGTYLLLYKIEKDGNPFYKSTRVIVKDTISPTIKLKMEEIYVSPSDSFDCYDYVESVSDNVSENVKYSCNSNLDFTLLEQYITYQAIDEANNTGYAKLKVLTDYTNY